ncbi:uncharacterized protein BX663DRAFT_522513 [Cokeromyces recurvatus]|uniref:uncharacterized protein n=1 Tax=Cokeromyces recurvatus TaxID=90255 RepID=UPI0022204E42|nr:uncharacterized protein BX663DRAFT_522513 [Cokeromyces recurvatus]KAI7899164.1 hypothetical protein BX663DRAFT_522513 [Cokeromyces recurvatus]
MTRKFLFLLFLLLFQKAQCYKSGDQITLYYNKLFSIKSQLTYDYASLSFICPPSHTSRKKSLLIFDEDIRGDRLIPSDYKVNIASC